MKCISDDKIGQHYLNSNGPIDFGKRVAQAQLEYCYEQIDVEEIAGLIWLGEQAKVDIREVAQVIVTKIAILEASVKATCNYPESQEKGQGNPDCNICGGTGTVSERFGPLSSRPKPCSCCGKSYGNLRSVERLDHILRHETDIGLLSRAARWDGECTPLAKHLITKLWGQ